MFAQLGLRRCACRSYVRLSLGRTDWGQASALWARGHATAEFKIEWILVAYVAESTRNRWNKSSLGLLCDHILDAAENCGQRYLGTRRPKVTAKPKAASTSSSESESPPMDAVRKLVWALLRKSQGPRIRRLYTNPSMSLDIALGYRDQ